MVFWQRRGALFLLLCPCSILYRFVCFLRKKLFQYHIKKITHLDVPVIVVGNITVGGTGKTPTVIWLAKFLKSQGLSVGIVSRGYGGRATNWPQFVTQNSQPQLVGDEAVLIVRQTKCPMVVAPDRVAAAKQLLNEHQCDVILSDDGLQHYALGRTMEIAVIDHAYLLGNGALLPAGPLREPATRLTSVDCIICNHHALELSVNVIQAKLKKKYGLQTLPTTLIMQKTPGSIYQLMNSNNHLNVDTVNHPVHAVSGIANPIRFFNDLRSIGLEVIEHPYPDHHSFKKQEIDFCPDDIIIMTEKDSVKCVQFADKRHWSLTLKMTMNQKFVTVLKKKLNQLGVLHDFCENQPS